MKTYLVGGAVRDQLLGLQVTEKDWVVTGSSAEELKKLGYRQVGSDFPVFLHPGSREEYALARTERKTAEGHQGFETETGSSVTLEDDLYRRDLTINAIAQDNNGRIIDPYHGQEDLAAGILRHVSPAFSDDPLRILRVARFSARFPGFSIHEVTRNLMSNMVARGDLAQLAPERIFIETGKALATDSPHVYFIVLSDIRADAELWPELTSVHIDRLEKWQSDNDAFHAFVILIANLPPLQINQLSQRLRVPGKFREMASLISRFHKTWSNVINLTSLDILESLYDMDAFRRHERFCTLCLLLTQFAQSRGEKVVSPDPWPGYLDAARQVSAGEISTEISGPELGEAIKLKQIQRIENLR